MALRINSTNGSVTISAVDGTGNQDITIPRSNLVGEDHGGELIVDSYNERFNLVTSSSNAITIDCETGNHFAHVLTENTTATFANPPASGVAYTMSIEIIQDAGASTFTWGWPASVDWNAATAPSLSTAANAKDIFVLITRDGGTTWYGFVAGQGMG